ncbi:unnamed protein product, partial [Thlaspi arvense]
MMMKQDVVAEAAKTTRSGFESVRKGKEEEMEKGKETKPLFGCLVETRVLQKNQKEVMESAIPSWQSMQNYDYHRCGRIWFCWSGEEVSPPLYHCRAALYKFYKQLKLLKYGLQALNKTHYGDIPIQTKAAYEVLCISQNQVLLNPTADTMLAVSRASDRWHHLAYVEERFFQQKSCVKWLTVGDHNTIALHQVAAGRVARNSIKTLEREEGVVFTNMTDVKREAASHFQIFLQSQPLNTSDISMDLLRDLLRYRCSDMGCLMDLTGEGGTRIFEATAAEAATDSSWRIRRLRSRHYSKLTNKILAQHIPCSNAGSDIVLWWNDEGISSSTWQQIRPRENEVSWHRVVPRQSFITLLSVRNRLRTRDHMRALGMTQSCVFCGELDETRNHLVHACPYTFTVWLTLARKILESAASPDWDDTLSHLTQVNHGFLDTILLKMRNARIHGARYNTHQQMARMIDKAIPTDILLKVHFPA